MRYCVLYLIELVFIGGTAVAAIPNVNQVIHVLAGVPANTSTLLYVCLCLILVLWRLAEPHFNRATSVCKQSSPSADRSCWKQAGRDEYFRNKRIFDVSLAVLLIVFLAPFLFLIWLIVSFDLRGQALFFQERPGRGGHPFRLIKFRTMKINGPPKEAVTNQVSSIGAFLRRFRLDELPQLINILKGDMSFVGPRPLLPDDQPNDVSIRLSVPPGLTGWAQINGGRALSREDKARLDAYYLSNRSMQLDVEIVASTIRFVLVGECAIAKTPDIEGIVTRQNA